jgi:hypothetical protein
MYLEMYLHMYLKIYLEICLEMRIEVYWELYLDMCLEMHLEMYLASYLENMPGNDPGNILDMFLEMNLDMYLEICLGHLSGNTPDWIDDGKGGKQLVFRGKDGEIKRNPENNLNPFSASDLFTSKIADVLDLGKKQGGAGTGGAGASGGKQSELSLSGVKTQVDADEQITDYLMGKGLVRGSADYNKEFDQIRTENNVGDLDLR